MNVDQPATVWRDFQATPSDHRPALDGVRGIAILTVFLFDCLKMPSGGAIHFLLRKISTAGWTGVDLFFVLSGFLITGILIDSRRQPGYLSSFFIRRSLRIFPLYFLSLWTAFVFLPQFSEFWPAARPVAAPMAELGVHQLWFWTYTQNWLFAFQGNWPTVNYLNHFWSLAVEEQFYLIWPFVVGWLSPRRLAWTCWGCVAVALGLRIGMWSLGMPSVALYVTTLTRMDSLCLGALFAMGMRSPVWYPRLTRWVVPTILVLVLLIAGVDLVWPLLQTETCGSQTIGHLLLGVLFGSFVFLAASLRPQQWTARLLSQRWLTLPGQFSYAMYVIHRPIYKLLLMWDWSFFPEAWRPLVIFVATLFTTLAAAGLTWKFIEKQFLLLKAYFPRPDARPPIPFSTVEADLADSILAKS